MGKKVIRTAGDGTTTMYASVTAAAAATGKVAKTSLLRVLNLGKSESLGGFTWKYEETSRPSTAAPAVPGPSVNPGLAPESSPVGNTDAEQHARGLCEALKTDDGRLITEMRMSDGYICATKMCQSAGKLWADFFRIKSTQDFLSALSSDMGLPILDLVRVTRGGNPQEQGTWVHPRVATHLAQHCSAEFAVKVTEWVERLKAMHKPSDEEYANEIENIKGSNRNNNIERMVQEALRSRIGGQVEVPCEHGRIDLVTEDTLIEVKALENYSHALGQVLLYGQCMPNLKKRIHLFGYEDEDGAMVRKARKGMAAFDVTCTYERIHESTE